MTVSVLVIVIATGSMVVNLLAYVADWRRRREVLALLEKIAAEASVGVPWKPSVPTSWKNAGAWLGGTVRRR